MIPRRTLLTTALAAGTALGLAACGGDDGSGAEPSASGGSTIDAVTVSGEVGAEPVVTFQAPLSITEPASKIVVEGTGEAIAAGDMVALHTAYIGAQDGKVLQSAWQGAPANVLAADAKTNGAQTAEFLQTAKVGGRFVMLGQVQDSSGTAVPIVQVSDIVSKVLPRAAGTATPPPADQPQFTLGDSGVPQLSGVPSAPAPTSTVATVTIEGDGPVTEDGQTLVMHYSGWKYSDGSPFDSSWERGAPFEFVLGQGQVIAGWDGPLAGQKVGSQVLLVIPPAEAYGEKGSSTSQLAGETLIFVADILDAVAPPA